METVAVQSTNMAGDAKFEILCQTDTCCHSIELGTPSAYVEACGGSSNSSQNGLQTNDSNTSSQPTISGCPQGCITHKNGCDIKGNVSYNTGEKIYHTPEMKYYDATTINPDYGDKWFCTETEAINNGFRKGMDY